MRLQPICQGEGESAYIAQAGAVETHKSKEGDVTTFSLSDEEISRLISLKKTIVNPRARRKVQRGSEQQNFKVESECGQSFVLYTRQNKRVEESFSCGLKYCHPEGKHKDVTLCRYNGSDHVHENPLDGYGKIHEQCHIHKATQRYMEAGRKAEHYAETTNRYHNLRGAVLALHEDCNIESAPNSSEPDVQADLWGDDRRNDN